MTLKYKVYQHYKLKERGILAQKSKKLNSGLNNSLLFDYKSAGSYEDVYVYKTEDFHNKKAAGNISTRFFLL